MSNDELVAAIRAIAHGDNRAPGGLEYLAMVLGSDTNTVANAIREGLYEIATAIRESNGND